MTQENREKIQRVVGAICGIAAGLDDAKSKLLTSAANALDSVLNDDKELK